MRDIIERVITGIIFVNKPSPNKIHDAEVTGESKRAFYDHIHPIAQEAPDFFRQIFKCLQEDPKMVMQVGDVYP